MQVQTARFGALEIEESKVIEMPQGMLGFADTRFVLLTPPNLGPFCWLQSVSQPELAFVVTDAKHWFPRMEFRLTAEECSSLELGEAGEVVFLLVVTMASDPKQITANLRGPIALNPERQIARQIVFEGDTYPTRQPLFAPQESVKGGRRGGKKPAPGIAQPA